MSIYFDVKPPPQISDKQLEEREHTIEQWKGRRCCPLQSAVGSAHNEFVSVQISILDEGHPTTRHMNANNDNRGTFLKGLDSIMAHVVCLCEIWILVDLNYGSTLLCFALSCRTNL